MARRYALATASTSVLLKSASQGGQVRVRGWEACGGADDSFATRGVCSRFFLRRRAGAV